MTEINRKKALITRMVRGETSGSKSPMWRCTTSEGDQVNIFSHNDAWKDSFRLFREAGYGAEMISMALDSALVWETEPVIITMVRDGKWWNITGVDKRPIDAVPDAPFVPNNALYKEAVQDWAKDISRNGLPVVYWDTETTGLTALDEIIEIGVIDAHGETILSEFIRPSKLTKVNETIQEITGIKPESLVNALTFPTMYPYIAEALNGKIWLIYNAKYDTAMLDNVCLRHGLKPIRPLAVYCVMERFAEWSGEWKETHFASKKLTEACEILNVQLDDAHCAIEDAFATYKVVQALANGVAPTLSSQLSDFTDDSLGAPLSAN